MKQSQPSCQIQFRHMPKLNMMHQLVMQQLKRFADYSRCEVVIDESRHGRSGIYDISVRLSIPGERLYAAHVSETSGTRDFVYGAVSSAFDDIKRQLVKKRGRKQRRHHDLLIEQFAA
ncbi:MAG: HPF/RaiA family ribosome-associated protein [Kiritimatiellales bacterium]|nr:HPF/RaiA family ribosome-associated protein [Kiritimatiellales bacterium]